MSSIIEQYGYLMTPEYRALNESRERAFQLVKDREDRQRLKEEIIAEVMKRIQIEYKTNATQAAKELQTAINSVFQGH